MTLNNQDSSLAFDAWNPGLSSHIPSALEPMITLFRPGNSTIDFKQASELSDFCGLSAPELAVFTVERLLIHELLVRVTCDLSVPDGPNYEDLGINLRSMVAVIYDRHIVPELDRIQSTYDEQISAAQGYIRKHIEEQLFDAAKEPEAAPSLIKRIFSAAHKPAKKVSASMSEAKEFRALGFWRREIEKESCPVNNHCLSALIKVVDSIISVQGRIVNNPDLIIKIVVNHASNNIGTDVISEFVNQLFYIAAKKEGYRILPVQARPVVMNVKGASASGKSTIRPRQQQLADKLGIAWEDFALISPDYWRKYLLDYESLGESYKYAAMLTGQELAMIDKKLDRYMAEKAKRDEIPHLLIDRFRFDSFSVDNSHSQDSQLLSRFGDRIYLFFMITSPSETVVRAWERGMTTGRYKAVDDLLYHNIEAFTGMPELFFSWVLSNDKRIRFEFLNNNVKKGEVPETIAFGSNNNMTILDLESLCKIDRYRQVNINASSAEQVFPSVGNSSSCDFIKRCIRKIDTVQLAQRSTGDIYAKFKSGELNYLVTDKISVEDMASELQELFAQAPVQSSTVAEAKQININVEKQDTLGRWGVN